MHLVVSRGAAPREAAFAIGSVKPRAVVKEVPRRGSECFFCGYRDGDGFENFTARVVRRRGWIRGGYLNDLDDGRTRWALPICEWCIPGGSDHLDNVAVHIVTHDLATLRAIRSVAKLDASAVRAMLDEYWKTRRHVDRS